MLANSSVTEETLEKLIKKELSTVAELDLSGHKVKSVQHEAFKKMTSLNALNLCNNELKLLPSNLGLQGLRRLDVSDNCLQSLEFVEQMTELEDLRIEGNGFQLADKFIAIFMCPRLINIDGKPADRLKTAVQQCRDKFQPLIESCWMEHFASDYPEGIGVENLDAVMQKLVDKVKSRKLCSPGVPQLFRDFMIDKLSTNLIMTASTGPYTLSTKSKNVTQEKDMEIDENFNDSSKPTSKFDPCPPVSDYEPIHFIRCHFCDKNALREGYTDDDPMDEVTNVWCCAMEPDPVHRGKSTGIVATCGGDIVCLIDCSTGKVMKRYKEPKEEFYSLAWTTVTLENDGNKRKANILAVGGFNGHLRLIDPTQLLCYGHYGTGRPNRAVVCYYFSSLLFHSQKNTWLFCGSSDSTITLFDIGVPSGVDYQVEIKPLRILVAFRQSPILNLAMHSSTGHLVAGTENGCYIWDVAVKTITEDHTNKRREPMMELSLPVNGRPFVDGLVMVDNTYLACKSVGDGFIYVLNLTTVIQRKVSGKVFGFEWVKTKHQYISLGTSNGLLACGDAEGNLYLYNIKPIISGKKFEASSYLAPSRILSWPTLRIDEHDERTSQLVDQLERPEPLIMNMVAISQDQEYIVVVTDFNLVCVWKRAS